jgi:signal transduction histidine kinase/CheY-like chemotaxis protein
MPTERIPGVAVEAPAAGARPFDGEAQFRRLLDTLPAAAYTCGTDGRITYFNPHAARLWGRAPTLNDPGDLFCGSFRLFTPEGIPIAHADCWMALALRDGEPYNGREIVIERPDGTRLTAIAHAIPIHDEWGGPVGAVNVLVDTTERKRAEEALLEADRAKNEFIATLAHELRNPLAPIRNAVQFLHLKGPDVPELRWALGVIDRQVRQMVRLTDDLLDIARITSNRIELSRAPVALAEMLDTAVETSRPLIEVAGLDLEIAVPPDAIVIDGDLIRLSQVVSNLLNNAAKYTTRGGRIWLRAERRGDQAVITVRDTGVGIPPDKLACVFNMFTQVDRKLARSLSGLGIGLNLARRLVEMHGGTIEARSEGPEKGSEFVVRLPALPIATVTREPGSPTSGDGSALGLRILVVDDDHQVAGSFARLLRVMGNDVRVAYDGEEALATAEAFRPDVIFLDAALPRLNGYEAARTLRGRPWGREVVLIAVTGWGDGEYRRRSSEAGFDHHLVKPSDPEAVTKLLEQVARRKSAC